MLPPRWLFLAVGTTANQHRQDGRVPGSVKRIGRLDRQVRLDAGGDLEGLDLLAAEDFDLDFLIGGDEEGGVDEVLEIGDLVGAETEDVVGGFQSGGERGAIRAASGDARGSRVAVDRETKPDLHGLAMTADVLEESLDVLYRHGVIAVWGNPIKAFDDIQNSIKTI